MIVRKIALNGWRNYAFAAAEFSPGTNVITGENAQGKTNLLEAVYLLTGGKSFRTRFDKELIGFGYTSAEVLADVYAFGREQTVRVVLRQGQRKQIWQNGVKKTAAELAGNFAAVLFCPDDLNLIKEGAAARRRLMDNAISQIRPRYAEYLSQFNKFYESKTRILKDWREKPSLLDTLDEFSDGMCRTSAQLIRYRASFAARLADEAAPIHSEFSGADEKLGIEYSTVSAVKDPTASAKEIFYDLCDHMEAHRRAELDSGQCLSGAHKDDLITSLSIKPLRLIMSFGVIVALLSFVGVIWAIVAALAGRAVAGWASMTCIICFVSGVQLISLGIIGEYVGKMYMETKARPRYIISERTWEQQDTTK